MNNIKLVDVFWFTNPYEKNVMGIVKGYDKITKEYNYYVGFGRGLSEKEDIKDILAWGTKYKEENFKLIYSGLINSKIREEENE